MPRSIASSKVSCTTPGTSLSTLPLPLNVSAEFCGDVSPKGWLSGAGAGDVPGSWAHTEIPLKQIDKTTRTNPVLIFIFIAQYLDFRCFRLACELQKAYLL